jgi:hypothetical protein
MQNAVMRNSILLTLDNSGQRTKRVSITSTETNVLKAKALKKRLEDILLEYYQNFETVCIFVFS